MDRLNTGNLRQCSSSAFTFTATGAEKGVCTYHFDIVLYIVETYLVGGDLQQNAAAVPRQWPSGQKDHHRDEDTNCRIGIVSRFSMGFPYDEG